MFEAPKIIKVDDRWIYYYDDNDEIVRPPFSTELVDPCGEWLSTHFQEVTFDINFSRKVRRASQAEALYCCMVVAYILNDKSRINDIIANAKLYNFDKMLPNEGVVDWRTLLNDFKSESSKTINIIISACRYKLSSLKKIQREVK